MHKTAKSVLPAVWNVPEIFRKRLGDQVGRQRAMFADGHLLLVLHKPPKPEDDQRSGRFFWRAPDGTWSSDELGSGPHALDRHLTEYEELVERFDQMYDAADSADEYFAVVYGITPVHRAARNLHKTLQEARESLPDERHLINFRDRAYQLERNAELVYTDARNGLEYAIAKRAEEQAAASHRMAVSAHRLNILAAFFFPIATLSTIFGMELRNGLEAWDETAAPLPFVALLVLGLVLGFVLKGFVSVVPHRADGK